MARSRRTTTEPSRIVGQRLREMRKRRPMSQADLAEAVNLVRGPGSGWHQTTVAKVERGDRRVDIEEVFALAAALEVSPMWLLLPGESDRKVRVGKHSYDAASYVTWLYGKEALSGMDAFEFDIAKRRAAEGVGEGGASIPMMWELSEHEAKEKR